MESIVAVGISFGDFCSSHTVWLLQTTPAKTSAGVQAKQVGSKKQQIAAEGAAERTEMEEAVHLNASCQERSGGDARVRLSCPLSGPPKGSTVHLAHPAHSALGGESRILTLNPCESLQSAPWCTLHAMPWIDGLVAET